MSISLLNLSHGIRDLITEKGEAEVGLSIPMIAGMVPTIAEAFARVIAGDPDKRNLLFPVTPFQNTITGGFCDLTGNLVDDKLLLDYWDSWHVTLVTDSTFPPFHMVRERSQLKLKRPTDSMFICAAIEGQKLWTRNVDGALDADLGDILISGPFIPLIAESAASTTLPFNLEGDFTRFGAMFLLGNLGKRNGSKR